MTQSYPAQPLPPHDPDLDTSQNHYWSYHNLAHLLACKKPLTASQDEDLFIAVHQICELAFQQMITDLERTLEALAVAVDADPVVEDTSEALYFLRRVLRLWEVVLTTMPILGTMRGFAEFRTTIGPTSGFQSFQFRRLEVMSGVQEPYWKGGTNDAQGIPHPAEVAFNRRYAEEVAHWFAYYREHSLTYYYRLLLGRASGQDECQKIHHLLDHPHAAPLLKDLASYDSFQIRFHRAHLGLAIQQLTLVGADKGTGGTAYRAYLSKYDREMAPLFASLQEAYTAQLSDAQSD
ncbi:tryptophan 2,3-dioxygenase family protein [Anthocerotibacter panamensis]|uniref:tryptophan 2,3-dioxygenase family protein n=1 Tax=Anthocerotibacter panamensis TaxID=2857077 RepID=UPI001C40478E|nr:tryptophan 2,3-dioxygenase family protein [Anthocerotibacter panamensis]